MKNQPFTKDKNFKIEVLKRTIILCWSILIVCFLVKIFGYEIFNIICNNEKFINFCNYVDDSLLYYAIGFLSYYASGMILWLAMARQLKCKKKEFLILSLMILLLFIIQSLLQFIDALLISLIFTLIRMVLIPLFLFKIKWKNILIVNLFDIIFQLISAFTKNVSIENTIYESTMVGLIFLIDYYIMIILLYLYSYYTNERRNNMGLLGTWFLHKDLADLEALLPTLTDEEEIAECKKRIEELKNVDKKEDDTIEEKEEE